MRSRPAGLASVQDVELAYMRDGDAFMRQEVISVFRARLLPISHTVCRFYGPYH